MTEQDASKDPIPAPADPFDALERVQVAIGRADSTNAMLGAVLDELLEMLDCDRAWLVYPCNPEAETFGIPVERTRPEWPGAGATGVSLAVNEFVRQSFRACLESPGPVRIDLETGTVEDTDEIVRRFGVQSMLGMAIRPADDEPWLLGIHNCSKARNYGQDMQLFRAIGLRVQDSLTAFQAIRELRQSEERLRTIVEHAPEAIVIYDIDEDRFLEANPPAVKLFGFTRQELLAEATPTNCSPEFQPSGEPSVAVAQRHIEAALGGAIPTFEWMHQSRQGDLALCEVRLVHLNHPTRRLIRGSMIDITERRRAEEERIELEARLAQSQRMEAIGQLSGGIAHDFNNLLTVILGNLELLDDVQEDEEIASKCVSDIRRAAERARSLTHRLLAFSRRQPLKPIAVDVAELLRGMDRLLRRTLREDIDIDLAFERNVWKCEADETQLQSAILNLVINARDAMPDGGRLAVMAKNSKLDYESVDQSEEFIPGEYVCLTVSDSGSGIAREDLDKIFAPFFTTKAVGVGSGLGLSMVYGFVKQSGGHIRVHSEVGVGTTMRLYLPRAMPETMVRGLPSAPLKVKSGHGECVLVVEDADSVRQLTQQMLEQLGYRVLGASDGSEALDILTTHPEVELLLTDIVLPGDKNGAQLARTACEEYPELSVLYMSGYAEDSNIRKHGLDPKVGLLEKPFTRSALASGVQGALLSRKARDSTAL